jgi:uncharacterized protein (TIGR02186 family)
LSKKMLYAIFGLLLALFPLASTASARLPIHLQLAPAEIEMGLSYQGVDLTISGKIPSNSEVLVRVTGKPEHQKLKKKGRALGLLWMNMGAVSIDNVPSVYLLYPSAALAEIEKNQPEQWRRLGMGFEALRDRVQILPADEDKEKIFGEFVKLKEDADLYGIERGAVHYQENGEGLKSFSCVAPLPSDLVPGEYTVEAMAVKDGTIAARGTTGITAAEIGVTAALASLAFNHGTLYGVLAVLVALMAGLFTGVVFNGSKGAH